MQVCHQTEFVFGGSFDPVHLGHQHVLRHLRGFSNDWPIRILPCAIPPFKKVTKASFEQRIAMLELATAHITNVVIDQREKSREGKSFTVDSLTELRKENQGTRMVLVIGADILNTMGFWHKCDKLSQRCHLMLVNRAGYTLDKIGTTLTTLGFSHAKSTLELEIQDAGRYYCLSIEEREVSSTILRENLANKRPVDQLLPMNVAEYINKNNLY